MGSVRRLLLTALPKFALSRTTGMLTRTPLPRGLRAPLYRAFARRYGADLAQIAGDLADYPSFAAFFRRPLTDGARPIAQGTEIVAPCDGRVITSGPITGGRITQVKGRDYTVAALLQDAALAARLDGGSQLTVYLAPGDYHRVHSPISGLLLEVKHIPGALFPVNPGAVDSIPELFPRNERVVFHYRLPWGDDAAVVMVSALNVGDTLITATTGRQLEPGDEIGQFGFGSTTIVLTPKTGPAIPELPRELALRMGQRLTAPPAADGAAGR
jgi:phosphatidylserine decarboxylase